MIFIKNSVSLTSEERGLLEKSIDQAIEIVPPTLPSLRNDASPLNKLVENKEDFVLGQMLGWVFGVMAEYMSARGKLPTPEIMDEISKVVLNRMPELKEAIFKQG